MVDLIAKTPLDTLLPLSIGAATLREVTPAAITSVAPYRGQEASVSKALQKALGVDYPAPNSATMNGDVQSVWFGHDTALVVGAPVPEGLSAAIVDQSDAWAVAMLEGAAARDVLARLVPADIRGSVFGIGQTMRTQIKHMSGSVTRVGADAYQLMVFRSMAKTLVHDVQEAMERVAARS